MGSETCRGDKIMEGKYFPDSDLFSILFPSIYVENLSLKEHVSIN
jgi:hypothetical protein